MTLITDKPEGLPSGNDLDDIPDDILGLTPPAAIRLGNRNLLVMDKPPVKGEFIKLEITLQHKGAGFDVVGEDEMSHYCKMRFVAAKVVAEPYTPAPESEPEPDPSLFDHAADDPDDDDADDSEAADDLDEFDPKFSHNRAQ